MGNRSIGRGKQENLHKGIIDRNDEDLAGTLELFVCDVFGNMRV